MVKKVLVMLVILCIGLGVVITLQPDSYTVQRSVSMTASPAAVFAQVNDFAAWDRWSPWKRFDPNPKVAISVPSAGKGAIFSWSGNDRIGEGRLTILHSEDPELVVVEQTFVRPFAGTTRMEFAMVPQGGRTVVTWKMFGNNDFFGKAMCLAVDMDAKLGKDFTQGLANMRAVVEKGGSLSAR